MRHDDGISVESGSTPTMNDAFTPVTLAAYRERAVADNTLKQPTQLMTGLDVMVGESMN